MNLTCETHNSLFNITRGSSSTTYTFAADREIIWYYDADVWDQVSGIYFQACFRANAGTGDTAYMHLANLSGTEVTGSEVSTTATTNVTVRSGDISGALSDGTDYRTEWKTAIGGGCSFDQAITIVAQSGVVTKTETVIEIGEDNNVPSTSYSAPADFAIWLYTAAEYDGTVAFYFEADLHCNASGDTTAAQLYDITAGAAVASSEVTHTGDTTTTRKRSGAITLVDGHEYRCDVKGTSTSDDAVSCKIVIQQSGTPTTTTKYNVVLNGLTSGTTTTYTYQGRLMDFDASAYAGDTKSFEYEATLKSSSGNTAYYNLNNDTDASELAAVTTTSTSYARSRDTSVTMPSDDNNVLNSGRKIDTAGTVTAYRSFLIVKLTWSAASTVVKDLIQVGVTPFAR